MLEPLTVLSLRKESSYQIKHLRNGLLKCLLHRSIESLELDKVLMEPFGTESISLLKVCEFTLSGQHSMSALSL